MTDDTLWRIYSMTKPVTSVATMILYEEGRLALTDPVSACPGSAFRRYLPAAPGLISPVS